ncbi:MAG: helix-turn-helix domain-containing protein [Candidatus Colwellbacteria bacterium]|nr:helix-turn-helix domain-containing protein [Candidatus Colwellbacteria bacterium]
MTIVPLKKKRMKKTKNTMDEVEDIVEVLKKLMKSKGVSSSRLASLTDVPSRFIDAILEGNFDQLPSQPYIRGYLFKISNALGAENDYLWHIFRSSVEAPSSGEYDRLPINRFALQKMSRKTMIWILAGLMIFLFISLNFNRIAGKPRIDVTVPDTAEESVITVSGTINPDDRLTLNGEIIYTNDIGAFEKQVQLEPGINTLEFKAKRYLGRETKLVKQVFYQPPTVEIEITDDTKQEN